ncbi:MAG: hypothetical protein R3F60_21655 [bacterium]
MAPAGLVARDHAVARALYLSKGAGSVSDQQVDPATVAACTTHEECAPFGAMLPVGQPGLRNAGGRPLQQPHPRRLGARRGGRRPRRPGRQPPATRATPGNRQFGIIHREEFAYLYSPEVFEGWGMGDRGSIVDADLGNYPDDAQVFSTALPPNNDCSTHQSMGADACLARVNGEVALRPLWVHLMTVAR